MEISALSAVGYGDQFISFSLNWEDSAPVTLTAGQLYNVEIDYYNSGGAARAVFYWQTVSGDVPFEPVPMEPSAK